MRCLTGWTALLFLCAVPAWGQNASSAPATQSDEAPTAKAVSADAQPAQESGGDRWRFKRHQNVWWYWLPSNKWVYWTGDRWVDYDATSYAQFQASRNPQPVTTNSNAQPYSNAPRTSVWGPERYNQYGQPQYPYSQRTSGIRQLGPVPAMGGVRSLPGWGGER
jgi:hypothetical protein